MIHHRIESWLKRCVYERSGTSEKYKVNGCDRHNHHRCNHISNRQKVWVTSTRITVIPVREWAQVSHQWTNFSSRHVDMCLHHFTAFYRQFVSLMQWPGSSELIVYIKDGCITWHLTKAKSALDDSSSKRLLTNLGKDTLKQLQPRLETWTMR